MKITFFPQITGILLCAASFNCYAVDLLTAYGDALVFDQAFQSATAQRLASKEALPQSWASLLPSLTFTGTSFANRTVADRNTFSTSTQPFVYNSNGYALNFSQAIINYSNWFQVSQAKATVKQADAAYAAAAEDLIIRVATAYFTVLQAQDTLRYTQSQKKSVQKQLSQAKERFNVGLDTITTLYNAQAAYDGLVAQEIGDKNTVANSFQDLAAITGIHYSTLDPIKSELPLLNPDPADVNKWIAAAENQNLTLRSLRFAADAARENIKVYQANHVPTINFTGNYTASNTGPSSPIENTNLTQDTVQLGFQMNAPLIQGGMVLSQTRQAQANFQKATADMEKNHNEMVAKTHQTYNDVLSGISKIKADKQAVKSKASAVESNTAGYEAGVVTIVDVLKAQQDLYDAYKTLSTDQYKYLISTLTLKQLTGTLTELQVKQINQWLKKAAY